MFINWALQEINLKIVYYGPGLSGKTTNLNYIYQKLDPSLRTELVSLSTKEDRTLFFDFMQLELGKINGKIPKFNLYTVPGQVYYKQSRKIILNGVDGIVFVADSQRERIDENLDTLLDLEHNLIDFGESLQHFPWVIQYNKRDLANCESIEILQQKLNFFNVPYFESVAHKGTNVFSTLKSIINRVIANIQASI
jgi:mutual gliding-motility protein MglA